MVSLTKPKHIPRNAQDGKKSKHIGKLLRADADALVKAFTKHNVLWPRDLLARERLAYHKARRSLAKRTLGQRTSCFGDPRSPPPPPGDPRFSPPHVETHGSLEDLRKSTDILNKKTYVSQSKPFCGQEMSWPENVSQNKTFSGQEISWPENVLLCELKHKAEKQQC